jgi:hypothetical protein
MLYLEDKRNSLRSNRCIYVKLPKYTGFKHLKLDTAGNPCLVNYDDSECDFHGDKRDITIRQQSISTVQLVIKKQNPNISNDSTYMIISNLIGKANNKIRESHKLALNYYLHWSGFKWIASLGYGPRTNIDLIERIIKKLHNHKGDDIRKYPRGCAKFMLFNKISDPRVLPRWVRQLTYVPRQEYLGLDLYTLHEIKITNKLTYSMQKNVFIIIHHGLKDMFSTYCISERIKMDDYRLFCDTIRMSIDYNIPIKKCKTLKSAKNESERIHSEYNKIVARTKLLELEYLKTQPMPSLNCPNELEEYRIKTKYDMKRYGMEYGHCLGSYIDNTKSYFLHKDSVCMQISDNQIVQCYDRFNQKTEKSKQFEEEVNKILSKYYTFTYKPFVPNQAVELDEILAI